jgi:hypothetical protein
MATDISPADGFSKAKGHYPGEGVHKRLSHVLLDVMHIYCVCGPSWRFGSVDRALTSFEIHNRFLQRTTG